MNTFFLIYNTHYVQQNAVLVALCIKIRYLDIWDTNFPPHPRASQTEKSSGVNDVIFMLIYVLFFKCCAILRTFECQDSLL